MPKVFCLEVCIVQAVHEEIQTDPDRLPRHPRPPDSSTKIVVGKRQKLHKDLADNTNARFLDILQWQLVKFFNDLTDISLEFLFVAVSDGALCNRFPLLMKGVRGAREQLRMVSSCTGHA